MLNKKLNLQTKVILFLFLFGALAFSPIFGQKKNGNKPVKIPDLVYPPPPEKARIKYIGSVSNSLDVEPPKQKGWLQKLVNDQGSNPVLGMVRPISVVVDSKERIFAADSLSSTVFVFDSKMKKMDLLGVKGSGRLVNPFGLAVDKSDNVYVSDTALKRVNVYNPSGDLIASINKVGNEFITNPTGLAIDDANNRLLIVDSRAHKIFVSDLNQLDKGETFGQKGEGDSEFFFPSYVAVDKDGAIYVSDTLNFCIKVFDKNFKFIKRIGEHGTGMGMFDRPKGIALDSEGHLYVIDSAFSNFQIFDKDGNLLLFVGNYGEEPGFFRLPSGIFIDKHDRIYVADQINRRIQMFQYLAGN
ncbi:MAG: 6-bladed beta-propeller [Pyrinomonadaceae bacterium]|nr:6-bladed beta-propeller [Pyrinomonadaceae bacterium]